MLSHSSGPICVDRKYNHALDGTHFQTMSYENLISVIYFVKMIKGKLRNGRVLLTWLTELSVKSMSSSMGATASRDLKNFFGFGAPAMTALVEEPRFRSELEPTPMPMDAVVDGLIDEKLPHFPTIPEDFEVTAGKYLLSINSYISETFNGALIMKYIVLCMNKN